MSVMASLKRQEDRHANPSPRLTRRGAPRMGQLLSTAALPPRDRRDTAQRPTSASGGSEGVLSKRPIRPAAQEDNCSTDPRNGAGPSKKVVPQTPGYCSYLCGPRGATSGKESAP